MCQDSKINKSSGVQSTDGVCDPYNGGSFGNNIYTLGGLERFVIPLIIILLPLRHVAYGIDLSDTGYNLACFKWFGMERGQGMWSVVTYLANVVGHFFTLLPGGDSWLGMNVYCSLVVSLIGLIAWYYLKKDTGVISAGLGIILAQLLCWCPHVILYNYLTYLILLVGTILVLKAGDSQYPYICMIIAGFILGMGVGVRFSNLTHMALIIILWYHGFNSGKKLIDVVKETLICVLGYIAGIVAFLAAEALQFGLREYLNMVTGLMTMSDNVEGYSGLDMITGPFKDYLDALWPWGILFIAYCLAGTLFYNFVCRHLFNAGSHSEKISEQERDCPCSSAGNSSAVSNNLDISHDRFTVFKCFFAGLFVLGALVLIRLCYGRGMFGIAYHEYFSMVRWAGLFNMTALILNFQALFDKNISYRHRILSLSAFIMVLIVPLGSNNKSYSLINDLFFIAPVTFYHIGRLVYGINKRPLPASKDHSPADEGGTAKMEPYNRLWIRGLDPLPLRLMTTVLIGALMVQATGFGFGFIFRDGAYNEKRDTIINNNDILKGMHTRPSNAAAIQELVDYYENSDLKGRELILYGDVPGLCYIFDAPSALTSPWTNLGSYNLDYWNRDFDRAAAGMEQNRPLIIIGKAYEPEDEKLDLLMDFVNQFNYTAAFENNSFLVYK